jgi:hypothetical protein
MAGSLSDFSEDEILDHLLGGATYTPPATLYLAVFTAAPTDAGGGTEVTGGSYARLAITNNLTNFPASSGGAKSNGAVLDMVTASAGWGTVVAYALFDASSAGNMLGWADLTSSVIINNGDTLRFAAGALTYSLT